MRRASPRPPRPCARGASAGGTSRSRRSGESSGVGLEGAEEGFHRGVEGGLPGDGHLVAQGPPGALGQPGQRHQGLQHHRREGRLEPHHKAGEALEGPRPPRPVRQRRAGVVPASRPVCQAPAVEEALIGAEGLGDGREADAGLASLLLGHPCQGPRPDASCACLLHRVRPALQLRRRPWPRGRCPGRWPAPQPTPRPARPVSGGRGAPQRPGLGGAPRDSRRCVGRRRPQHRGRALRLALPTASRPCPPWPVEAPPLPGGALGRVYGPALTGRLGVSVLWLGLWLGQRASAGAKGFWASVLSFPACAWTAAQPSGPTEASASAARFCNAASGVASMGRSTATASEAGAVRATARMAAERTTSGCWALAASATASGAARAGSTMAKAERAFARRLGSASFCAMEAK